MKTSKKLVVLLALIFVLLPVFVYAAPSWWPIVPCGLSTAPTDPGQPSRDYTQPCNSCDLFVMGRNIIDFILIGLMPPVAAGLFIWGGFLILMGGPKPEYYSKGKAIFTTTFYGVLIILGSWLITNTIMMSVAQDSVEIKKADGTTETVNIVTDWSKFECEATTVVEPTPIPTDTVTPTPTSTTSCDGATLAANNNEPYPRKNSLELNALINCIKSKLPGVDLGSQFTYDESYELCNYTRGQRTSCASQCSHAVNSCHYGGRSGSGGAQAVDFGNQDKGDVIIQAAQACGVPSGKARCENGAGANVGCGSGSGANHVHISAAGCDAN